MYKESITVIEHVGQKIQHAYLIKDIEIDSVILEKYTVECREDIQSAWDVSENSTKTMEIVLTKKVQTIKMLAKPGIIETVSKNGGKIIKGFATEKAKRGNKVYIRELEFFVEAVK